MHPEDEQVWHEASQSAKAGEMNAARDETYPGMSYLHKWCTKQPCIDCRCMLRTQNMRSFRPRSTSNRGHRLLSSSVSAKHAQTHKTNKKAYTCTCRRLIRTRCSRNREGKKNTATMRGQCTRHTMNDTLQTKNETLNLRNTCNYVTSAGRV